MSEVRPVGDTAQLIELDSNQAVHAAARAAREQYGDQLAEIVPGHQTLLLVWRDGSIVSDISDLALVRAASEISDDDPTHPGIITIPVRYDGVDLDDVAAHFGVSREAIVQQHVAAEYVVAFMGFAPGFPYLVVDDESAAARLLELPRLEKPRTKVPAGSVAVAAGYCGVYPRSSPGGWNLLGRTEAVLFDAERRPAALLEPGIRVRFEPI